MNHYRTVPLLASIYVLSVSVHFDFGFIVPVCAVAQFPSFSSKVERFERIFELGDVLLLLSLCLSAIAPVDS